MPKDSQEELLYGDEDGIAQDVLPLPAERPAVPIALDRLFPWHRPRKQHIRQTQWVGLSRNLIDKLKKRGALSPLTIGQPDGTSIVRPPEVRYLTLPGLDYLDARLIGEACSDDECTLTCIGFLSDAEDVPVLARARVRETGLIQAGYISDRSKTLPRRFESISSAQGESIRELRRHAPFHIVNIDACGSVAPPAANHSGRLIDAIYRLLELQTASATHPWLLFLTVDVRHGDLDPDTLNSLCEAIRANAKASAEFEASTLEIFGKIGSLEESISFASSASGRPMIDLFSLGMAKWMLHLVQAKLWSVRLRSSYCYSTTPQDEATPTMCALAFEFIPPAAGLVDPYGASRQKPVTQQAEEHASLQIARKVAEISDADELLAADDARATELNTTTRALLAEAGYEASVLQVFGEDGMPCVADRFPDLIVAVK